MSQVAFAGKLGCSRQRLCDLEHDRFVVTIKYAKELATKLSVAPELLVKLALQDQLKREGIKLKVS
jgi:transcriptional regulator with XRE-family HTH domain